MFAAGLSGVGQTQRAVRIAAYLAAEVKQPPEMLIVTGVPDGRSMFPTPVADLVAPLELAELVEATRANGPRDDRGPLRAASSKFVQSVVDEFDPDIFVTTSHAGVDGELTAVLRSLGDRGRRRILALRDIYFPPRFVDEFASLSDSDFDSVLVGGPPNVTRWTPEGLLNGPLAQSVRLVGYLRPIESVVVPRARETAPPLIRCHVGGGRDGFELAAAVVTATRQLRTTSVRDLEVTIATGPLMPESDALRLRSGDDGWLRVEPWTVDPYGSKPSARRPRVVVSMAGYNSCVEAAWFGTTAVLSPRRSPNDMEQEIRSGLFCDQFDTMTALGRPDADQLLPILASLLDEVSVASQSTPTAFFADPAEVVDLVLGDSR